MTITTVAWWWFWFGFAFFFAWELALPFRRGGILAAAAMALRRAAIDLEAMARMLECYGWLELLLAIFFAGSAFMVHVLLSPIFALSCAFDFIRGTWRIFLWRWQGGYRLTKSPSFEVLFGEGLLEFHKCRLRRECFGLW